METEHVSTASQVPFVRLSCWLPFRARYAVFGNANDVTSLWDNLDYFEAAAGTWINRKSYELVDNPPFGFIFVSVWKWNAAAAEQAFINYAKRLEWNYPDFKPLMEEIMIEITQEDKAINIGKE